MKEEESKPFLSAVENKSSSDLFEDFRNLAQKYYPEIRAEKINKNFSKEFEGICKVYKIDEAEALNKMMIKLNIDKETKGAWIEFKKAELSEKKLEQYNKKETRLGFFGTLFSLFTKDKEKII